MGGTWYWNKYPGVACDISADVYSFSWNPNRSWSCGFPGAEEIQVRTDSWIFVKVVCPRRTWLTRLSSLESCLT